MSRPDGWDGLLAAPGEKAYMGAETTEAACPKNEGNPHQWVEGDPDDGGWQGEECRWCQRPRPWPKGGKKRAARVQAILAEIAAERTRQDEKWGPDRDQPNVEPLIDGRGTMRRLTHYGLPSERAAKARVESESFPRKPSWAGILVEEVVEAVASSDEERLRAELVQIAAVSVAWIENIDRRAGR